MGAIAIASFATARATDDASARSDVATSEATTSVSTTPEESSEESAPATRSPDLSSVDLGSAAWSAVYGFGGVWIQVDPPVDQLVKVDEMTGAVTLTVDAGTSAAIADDAVWVTVGGAETRKIDPTTGESLVVASTPDAYYIAVGAGAVWVPSETGVSRLDPTTGATTATVVVDLGVTDLQASDDALWVTHKDAGSVSRIDPATNAVVATIDTGRGAHDIAIDEHGVWITNYLANTVSRIDPATNTVVATIDGVGSGVAIAAGEGAIFVSSRDGAVSRIDPATNEVWPIVQLDGWVYGLAYGNGELWATNVDRGLVYRLDDDLLNAGGTGSSTEPSFDDPESLAHAIGCPYGGSDIEEVGVEEGGSCGDEVRIFTFASNEHRDRWFSEAQDPGRVYLVGDRWVISADTATTLEAAQVTVGGEIDE